jgi:hypothetical protein
MKALTKHERYLFSLTGSVATKTPGQRAAIARDGLTGKTKAEIHKIRLANWRETRAANPDVPIFVLAARMQYAPWQKQPPSPSMAGVVCDCRDLSIMAHDNTDWGRSRKHSRGEGTANGYRVREEDNGKIGWYKVVDRYADYGCVKSPDETKIAIQVGHHSWEVKALFRRRFFFRGEVYRLDTRDVVSKLSPRENLRAMAKLLQRHGWDATITYQTDDEVANGSSAKNRKGKNFVLVVDLYQFGAYHFVLTTSHTPKTALEAVTKALKQRRDTKRQAELDAAIAAGKDVYVGLGDSLAGGNCETGTNSFASEFCRSLGLDPAGTGGVLASVLLAFRDNQYTRRAVYAAMMRRG